MDRYTPSDLLGVAKLPHASGPSSKEHSPLLSSAADSPAATLLARWGHTRLVPSQLLIAVGMVVLLLLGSTALSTRQPAGDGGSSVSMVRLPSAACTSAQLSRCNQTTEYLPSDLEQLWLSNVATWEQQFCNSLQALENSTRVWLDTLAQLTSMQEQHMQQGDKSPAQVLAEQGRMDPRVFSRWRTTYDCGPGSTPTEHTSWIEPLSHGLRHPNALCNRGTDLMDRKYLLLSHRAEHEAASRLSNTQCKDRSCQYIYFDLGATTLQTGPQEAGQGWFYSAYRRQGISFDRFLLWEAVTQNPADVYKNVPKADMHKYLYFNIPVTPDATDPSNPVQMLKTIAQPGDFVVFKLDIDNYPVEHAILDALKSDPAAMALVDEFFFEEHVAFKEMLPSWGSSVGPDTSLATSFAMFYELRRKGLRAHSWV